MSRTFAVNIGRKLVSIIGLLVVIVVGASNAQAQSDPYSIQVAVVDRSANEQQEAYRVGMRLVLLENSGDKTLLNRDDVRAGLRAADTYVESFRYDAPAPGTVISQDTPLTDAVRNSGQATQLMQIQFSRELIEGLIRPASSTLATPAPVEGYDPFNNVSSALMWLIIEDAGKQVLVSGAAARNVMERLREIAGGSGIALSFPAGDDTDTQAIDIDDIKTANEQAISAAALRYAQPLTLASHLTRTRTGSWEGTWLKLAGGKQESQVLNSASLDDALQQGIAWLNPSAAGGVAATPSFQPNSSANLSSVEGLVWVSPLRSTKSYAEVMGLLSSLDGVTAAYPKEIFSGGVVFAIVPRSALPLVSNAASTRDWLRQGSTPSSASQSRFASGISASFEYLR